MENKRLVDTFIELVKIDSETGNERAICNHLLSVFESLGLEVFEDDTQQSTGFGAGNLFATLKGDSSIEPILFSCHMDTVTPGKGIEPIITDNVIHTDGSTILGADDKAGVAVMIELIRHLQENNIQHGDIQFVISVGEESHLVGASAMNPEHLKANYGFALDSGDKVGGIVVAAPTNGSIVAELIGKTAHAGIEPEKGISAITIAANAVSNMKLGRIDEETTANIGRIEGGDKTNIVADYCKIIGEARSLEQDKMTNQLEHMKQAFETAAASLGGKANVELKVSYPSFKIDENSKVVDIAKNASVNIGRTPEVVTSGGGSDANYINSYGVPTVVLSVGYEKIHTVNERMPIEELEALLAQTIEIVKLV